MKEILIYDEIGPREFGLIDAVAVVTQLDEAHGDDVTVRINSPGGDVFEGLAIYNALRRHRGQVDVAVDGLAASAASIVAMAGERITMADNALLMLHKAWTVAFGNEEDFIEVADILRKVDSALVGVYTQRTGQCESVIRDWMSAETWFNADEAIEAKLADGSQVKARNRSTASMLALLRAKRARSAVGN